MATRSRVGFVWCIVLLTALVGQSLLASNSWIRLTTKNFELYSTLDKKQAALLLQRLDRARQGLEQLSFGAQANPVPVRVFAFRSRTEYAPFRSDKAATAYYLHSRLRNYIVLGGDAVETSEPAVHEYVHYVLHQRFPNLPLWLDEGLAEVYSTVSRKEGLLRLGLPSESQLDWLRMDGFAYDLPALFHIEQTSFDGAKHLAPRSRFYAESWLLVHMLRLAPNYAPHFNAFLAAMDKGEPAERVLAKTYGKTEREVMSDLARYLDAERMPTELMAVNQGEAKMDAIETAPVSAADAHTALADLIAALGRRHNTRPELVKASQESPDAGPISIESNTRTAGSGN